MRAVAVAALLTLSACVSVEATETHAAPTCALGAPRTVATLFFGRNIGQSLGVSEEQWRTFVDSEVTPRFGDGLTMYDAQGQWRDADTGAIVREPSKVLVLILADPGADRAKIEAIAQAYKSQFQQQAVAVALSQDCIAFQ